MKLEHLYWLGIRETDIKYTNDLYSGSVTIFGTGMNENTSMERLTKKRYDYNIDTPEYYEFMNRQCNEIIRQDPDSRFMLYCPIDAYYLSDNIRSRSVAINPYDLINFFENKTYSKLWFSQFVPVLPFFTIVGIEFSFSSLKARFSLEHNSEYVIQADSSSGGHSTYHAAEKNAEEISRKILPHQLYTVSPYLVNNISVSFHAVIYQSDSIIFPGAVQIIDQSGDNLLYLGSDYCAYQLLNESNKSSLEKTAVKICEKMSQLGYRGICGMDLLLSNDDIYFLEINPRFLASSPLLNRELQRNQLPSLNEYCLDAFESSSPSLPLPDFYPKCSVYNYCYDRKNHEQLQWLHGHIKAADSVIVCCDDNLDWSYEFEDDTYMFKLFFDTNIVFADSYQNLRVNNVLSIHKEDISPFIEKPSLLLVKVALMNQGIRLSKTAEEYLTNCGGVDYKEFEAINILINNQIWVSAPYGVKLTELSPFEIDYSNSSDLTLCCWSRPVFSIKVQAEDAYSNCKTSNSHFYWEIGYKGTDRLRIYHRNGCCFKDAGIGCGFCDMPANTRPFSFSEISEVVDAYKTNSEIRHYMIGGGSEPLDHDFENIIAIAGYIRRQTIKPIQLMSLPCNNFRILQRLKLAGVTEVIFNLEIFDRVLAKNLMQGKGNIPFAYYSESFKEAVAVWGRGNVRSIVILGIDNRENFLKGIEELCKLDVSPTISLLKPIAGTQMEHYITPRNSEILEIYEQASSICNRYHMELGPSCPACENNIIKITLPE